MVDVSTEQPQGVPKIAADVEPETPNLTVERAYASHAMEGETHRRIDELEDLVQKNTEGELSILVAKQRQLAEIAMEGEERKRTRAAEEAAAKALAEVTHRKKEEAERLAKLRASEQAELERIATSARLAQHQILEQKQVAVDELIKIPALSIRPVRTLKEDSDLAIKGNNLSLVNIAIREDTKRRAEAESQTITTKSNRWFAILGTLLLLIGVAVLGFVVYTKILSKTPEDEGAKTSDYQSLLFAEKVKTVAVNTLSDTQLISILKNEVKNLNAQVGSVEDVRLIEANDRLDSISFQRFATLLRLNPPDTLLRNLEKSFMFGVHSFSENAGFLLLRPQNYEPTFAAMLEWEPRLFQDLAIILSGKTPDASLERTILSDVLIKNVSGRAVRDAAGKIILMYSFFNKENLIITSNEATFVEVITRLTTPRAVFQK